MPIEIAADTPPGSYYLCVRVDSVNEVVETDESNNVYCEPIEIEAEFCIDFEAGAFAATDGADATVLYADVGVRFPSAPRIFRQPPLFDGFQGLYQGDPEAARPQLSCAPMEIQLDESLEVAAVGFDARNVGFIDRPIAIDAVAFDASGGEVDRRSLVSRSRLGALRPFERIELASHPGDAGAEPPIPEEPPITRVELTYGSCPPHVAIDNLCVEPKRRESCESSTCPETLVIEPGEWWYETSPAFSCVDRIRLTAKFENADPLGRPLDFTGVSPQVWSQPAVISPPVVVDSAPTGLVAHGETYSYELIIDVSRLPAGEEVIALRPVSATSGTMRPAHAPLVSAGIECVERAP